MANNTRIWPRINTMTTVVRPASAPMLMSVAAQSTPLRVERRSEVGVLAGLLQLGVLLTIPDSTTATAT